MNAFLQSMLGRSTEEISCNSVKDTTLRDNDTKLECLRSSWVKKLGNTSPKKFQTMSSQKISISSIESRLHSISDVPTKVPVMFHPPTKMPDLETIIREFEDNFLSPTKSEASNNSTTKEGSFVKKIVAAFEDKYKSYNDSKIEEDVKAVLDNRKVSSSNVQERSRSRFSLPSESPKKRANIFGSTPKIFNESTANKESKMSTSFNSPRDKHNRQKNTWISIFSSPFKYNASKDSKFSQIFSLSPGSKCDQNNTKTTMEEEEEDEENHRARSPWDFSEIEELNDSRFDRVSSPFKTSDDETKSIQSVDLSLTYDFEDSTLLEIDVRTIEESTMIDCSDENEAKGDHREEEIQTPSSESSSSSKGSRRVPKIIGAFLKRPIEVEKTAVDWIPITGKKLPRKRSLKKLLSMLTRNKSNEKKREKIFSSERNINEEPRELQDSGYDEKSSTSTSSLRSLASISEILLHQDHSDRLETGRRSGSKLRTFQTRNSLNRVNDDNNDGEQEESVDEEILLSKVTTKRKKKLRLTEVPREIVTKDLGPCYPSHTATMTMSLDRRSHSKSSSRYAPRSRVPRHPYLSRIAKHPFVAMTKMDEIPQVGSPPKIASSLTNINDDRDKSFQIDREKLPDQDCIYDIPRRYLSKSEPKINEVEPKNKNSEDDEPIYDMPKPRSLSRPTSSIYEDALSLKRRLDYLPMVTVPNFYSLSDDEEPHYATIRRGNRRVHYSFNQQVPLASCTDLRSHELSTSL
ncbi:hypothetical protein KPH14_007052 [Odynerus spinipes]|uniref:Uncharacterized protein n=1 Tax=Odynerus spinipes TaxID=1348599 RepID=A0AAD9VS25_9HYME|nr:hypothetical protein KPH14_007052 [Odynerus spinipes]